MNEQARVSIGQIKQGETQAPHISRARTEAGEARRREGKKMAAIKRRQSYPKPDRVTGAEWIPLSRGMFALVDESDFEFLSQFTWSVSSSGRNKYAEFGKKVGAKMKTFSMHRLLLKAPANMQVDHRNGNGLDCRRSNLRVCLAIQNRQSKRKQIRPTSSKFKGVHWDKVRHKWIARIRPNWSTVILGAFTTEAAAGAAYNEAAIKHFGEYAFLNSI